MPARHLAVRTAPRRFQRRDRAQSSRLCRRASITMTEGTLDAIRSGMSRGVAWMLFQKLAERLLSLVSVSILARLLVPSDFGLVALAVSTLALLEVFGALGLDIALIRQPNANRAHFDAAWTFNVLFGCAIALLAEGLAPLASWFSDDPRLLPVILSLGAS